MRDHIHSHYTYLHTYYVETDFSKKKTILTVYLWKLKEHDMGKNARNATRTLSTKSARAALYKMLILFKQIDSNFQTIIYELNEHKKFGNKLLCLSINTEKEQKQEA